MTKGADPVHHRMVLDVPPKQIQSMDVDFADASGKVFKSTYFEFDLRRDGGYFEAGEYQVALSGPDGDVGGAQKLTLEGRQPARLPRRDGLHRPQGRQAEGAEHPGRRQRHRRRRAKVASNDDSSGSASGPSGGVEAVGNGGSMVPASAFNKTAEEESVQGHPKGCGCVAAGLEGGGMAGGGAPRSWASPSCASSSLAAGAREHGGRVTPAEADRAGEEGQAPAALRGGGGGAAAARRGRRRRSARPRSRAGSQRSTRTSSRRARSTWTTSSRRRAPCR